MFTHRFFFCRSLTCVCGWYGALCSQTVICASVLEPMQWFPWQNPDFFNAVVPEGLDLVYNQDVSFLCTGGKNISTEQDDKSHFSMGVSTRKINLWAVLNECVVHHELHDKELACSSMVNNLQKGKWKDGSAGRKYQAARVQQESCVIITLIVWLSAGKEPIDVVRWLLAWDP